MINESTLCILAKKLHGINPDIVIDDPVRVERLLEKWINGVDWSNLPNLTPSEDAALSTWVRARE